MKWLKVAQLAVVALSGAAGALGGQYAGVVPSPAVEAVAPSTECKSSSSNSLQVPWLPTFPARSG